MPSLFLAPVCASNQGFCRASGKNSGFCASKGKKRAIERRDGGSRGMAQMMQGGDAQLALAAAGPNSMNGKLEEPDHSSANWYFSREEIEKNSPSRKDGIDLKKETYFRKSYCTFLQDLGMRLKV